MALESLMAAYGGENCMFEGRGMKETVHYMCFSILWIWSNECINYTIIESKKMEEGGL